MACLPFLPCLPVYVHHRPPPPPAPPPPREHCNTHTRQVLYYTWYIYRRHPTPPPVSLLFHCFCFVLFIPCSPFARPNTPHPRVGFLLLLLMYCCNINNIFSINRTEQARFSFLLFARRIVRGGFLMVFFLIMFLCSFLSRRFCLFYFILFYFNFFFFSLAVRSFVRSFPLPPTPSPRPRLRRQQCNTTQRNATQRKTRNHRCSCSSASRWGVPS